MTFQVDIHDRKKERTHEQMGMSASQARFLSLTARKNNVEFEGQQINQQRTALSSQSANYYSQLTSLSVPVPPSTQDYSKITYTFKNGSELNTITSLIATPRTAKDGVYKLNYVRQTPTEDMIVGGTSSITKSPADASSEEAQYTIGTKKLTKAITTEQIENNEMSGDEIRNHFIESGVPSNVISQMSLAQLNEKARVEARYNAMMAAKYGSLANAGFRVIYRQTGDGKSYEPIFFSQNELDNASYNQKTGQSTSGVKNYVYGQTTETEEIKNVDARVEKDASGRFVAITINEKEGTIPVEKNNQQEVNEYIQNNPKPDQADYTKTVTENNQTEIDTYNSTRPTQDAYTKEEPVYDTRNNQSVINEYMQTEPQQENYKKEIDVYGWVDNPAYATYLLTEPLQENYKKTVTETTSSTNSELYNDFKTASKSCYDNATGGTATCYKHVIAHLLDLTLNSSKTDIDTTAYPINYKSSISTGSNDVTINSSTITGSNIHYYNNTDDMAPISDAICNGYDTDNDGVKETVMTADWNTYKEISGISTTALRYFSDEYIKGSNPTDAQILLSNYYVDPSTGEIKNKTLKQKCIDMFYLLGKYSTYNLDYNQVMLPFLYTFQKDMEFLNVTTTETEVDDVEAYQAAYSEWEEQKPAEQIYVKTGTETVPDEEAYQAAYNEWYANIPQYEEWQVQVGTKTVPDEDAYNAALEQWDANRPQYREWDVVVPDTDAYQTVLAQWQSDMPEYKTWIEEIQRIFGGETYRLTVTTEMDEAAYNDAMNQYYYDKAQYDQKIQEINSKVSIIQAQDKNLELKLKQLDTEENAILTEMDAVKKVISKNVESSFKTFNA